MDSGKLVLGVLAGLAIGATLGILFAPDKGSGRVPGNADLGLRPGDAVLHRRLMPRGVNLARSWDPVKGGGDQIVGDGQGQHQAFGLAILGDQGDAGMAGLGQGGRGWQALPRHVHASTHALQHAEQRKKQLFLPLPV